jgi:uncharacterized protein (DUF983 family)
MPASATIIIVFVILVIAAGLGSTVAIYALGVWLLTIAISLPLVAIVTLTELRRKNGPR